jgi:hypothetical protein
MIRRRDAFGSQTGEEAAGGAVSRGMADVLAALDNVIDDDVALGLVCRLGSNVAGAAGGSEAVTACGGSGTRPGMPGSAITIVPAGGHAASRRRLALLSAAAAAALTAAALAAIVVPGAADRGTGGPVVDTAYVVRHVDSALDAASAGSIAQMRVTTRGAVTPGATNSATAEEWSYGDQWRAVTDSAAGHLVYDEGISTASVYTVVSYQARTWARQREAGHPAALSPGPGSCAPVVAALPLLFQPGLPGPNASAGSLPATAVRALRAAVSCGDLAAAGRQRVNGIEALVLTSSSASPIPETIWVSPGTYLPVRVAVRPVPGAPGPWQTANITWLQPTMQNLANLTVPVPAGFRQVPLARIVRPLMRHISAGQPPASG